MHPPQNDGELEIGQGTRKLTARRLEVLNAVARGLTNKEIALSLGVSEQAVKMHVSALLTHFGVTTRTALVRMASVEGIIDRRTTQRNNAK